MALQDLTPQLRTRLSRVERAVGLFVILAALLLAGGFAYYLYNVGQRKGWFDDKVPYYTLLLNATGLKEGDPIRMMGYEVGRITEISPMPPGEYYSIYIRMHVREPFYGYLWKDSKAKVAAADFLGKRFIELTKGTLAPATVLETNSTVLGRSDKVPWGILDDRSERDQAVYLELTKETKGYFLPPEESPALTEKLDQAMRAIEVAIPNLTNALASVFRSTVQVTSNLNELLTEARPMITNLTVITTTLREPKGSLGEWILPEDLHQALVLTLTNASATLVSANTNVTLLATNITRSLINLAELTGNLNAQVQANSSIVTEISALIISLDEMVQGLKRHWLLRSAFRGASTNPPPHSVVDPGVEPLRPPSK